MAVVEKVQFKQFSVNIISYIEFRTKNVIGELSTFFGVAFLG